MNVSRFQKPSPQASTVDESGNRATTTADRPAIRVRMRATEKASGIQRTNTLAQRVMSDADSSKPLAGADFRVWAANVVAFEEVGGPRSKATRAGW